MFRFPIIKSSITLTSLKIWMLFSIVSIPPLNLFTELATHEQARSLVPHAFLCAYNVSYELSFVKHFYVVTVHPVLSGHSKINKTKVLMENGSLMKVESIAECSPWSIQQYF